MKAIFGLVVGIVACGGIGYEMVANDAPSWLVVLLAAIATAGILVGGRRSMLGVYVSDQGIKSRSLLNTTMVPWENVREIGNGLATIGGLYMGRDAIVIHRLDGPLVQTPVQRGDFMRPFTFRPELGRLATGPKHYDDILTSLRRHHESWCERHGRPVPAPMPQLVIAPVQPARISEPRQQVSQLHVLKRLHERGVLTDAEFERQSADLEA
ncbi:hypothetical protein Rhe02_72060 [Rhizocola hellebori]|uniref:SHOCT domain-containing protein n=1 Tax=Rhizocola hellebori TaxID=1392758 RepID=A0A8J3QGD5_9ACTN|nr:hypothetical protein Rhe02_72060 [Rhizocola hellebori]